MILHVYGSGWHIITHTTVPAGYSVHLRGIWTFWNTLCQVSSGLGVSASVVGICKQITQENKRKWDQSSTSGKNPWSLSRLLGRFKRKCLCRAGPKLFVVLNFNRPWDSFKMHIYLMDFLFSLCDGTAINEQGRSLSKQVHGWTLP